ncbi:Acetyl-CoA synthetase-like protein [Glarea lozoyensis ATCC 20868]|uniref:Acetyl-CoA synthetase-like protein n=1 Tax=Glarea lozoyensis (strain ATCC 20868 / MF5171) TaxID=1116229 RepID=S3E9A4_GLAL2|nr:Acetyl-CoA synthetase-like protein [Glarea lozoyensis ATCC 20868]EPE34858.1 Acetyl-CoA synthetase-like protein [Glarea lozoyensis ATCC 20868]
MSTHPQDEVQDHSLTDPESFWAEQASHLSWHKKPTKTLTRVKKSLRSGVKHDHWEWFQGGEISTCFNCVDRHVLAGNGDQTAIIWDSPVTKTKQKYTYKQLLDEVEVFAGVLRDEGVKKGDVVLVYMPMIPAALIGILAVSRLGAIHAVVFGGFAPASLAQRIEASKPVAILTASCGIDGAKPPTSYKPFITEAIGISSHKPSKTIIWQRDELRWDNVDKPNGYRNWQRLVHSGRARGLKVECVPVKSSDGVYIIYTSGTTGLPKGVLREAGGHAVGLHLSISYLFGIHGPGDVMFCASDIGWVVGHSYILYAPLLAGAATVLFEGKPVGTPDAGTFWRILEEYKVNTLFTAPTALRAIRRDDPENKLFKERGERGGLRSLQALFLAGERSEPSIVTMYQDLLEKYGKQGAKVIDNWWSSESGSPISGIALVPHAGKDRYTTERGVESLAIKPGSAGKAMPGFDVRVVDDSGKEVEKGNMGNIVMGMPLAPTGFRTLWEDEERFYKGYLKRFDGKWIDTGDAGMIDTDGYIHVMSRSDDIINVAAHRFSTGSIEQAISSHPQIAECCVVGIPDSLKGHLPFAFITLSTPSHPISAIPSPTLFAEVQKLVRTQIGAIASLGGMIQGKGMIPKTRSGKTLRRVLRELVENAVHGEFEKEVQVPATVEDAAVVGVAKEKIEEYFREKGGEIHRATEGRAML